MRILHVTSWFSDSRGGGASALMPVVQHQVDGGHDVSLAGLDDGSGGIPENQHLKLFAGNVTGPQRFGFSNDLRRHLRNCGRDADVVHSHGLWRYPNMAARRLAHRADLPLIVSPHGALHPPPSLWWRTAKQLARLAYENKNLHAADCIHAMGEAEVACIRQCGLRNAIAVIPPGVDAETFDNLPKREAAERSFPELRGRRIALFAGRPRHTGSFANLLQAWAKLPPRHSDWLLVAPETDSGPHANAMRAHANDLHVRDRVLFTPPLSRQTTLELLAATEFFVQSFYVEKKELTALHAAAAGVPVLITRQHDLRELVDAGGAIRADPDMQKISTTLANILDMPDSERKAIGEKAYAAVRKQYTWKNAAVKLVSLYAWLNGDNGPPPCIIVR